MERARPLADVSSEPFYTTFLILRSNPRLEKYTRSHAVEVYSEVFAVIFALLKISFDNTDIIIMERHITCYLQWLW
jgi:hypothetical protein